MRIVLVTDAWKPQVNGVVKALTHLVDELEKMGHGVSVVHPGLYRTVPLPTYQEIRLAIGGLGQLRRQLARFAPDAIHIATEGPLGLLARRYCRARQLPFTTSFHTRFPEYINARIAAIPVRWGYAAIRWFHGGARRTLVTTETLCTELRGYGLRNLVIWPRGVDTTVFSPQARTDLGLPRPLFLFVGRVAVEKNLEAFLNLHLPGTKIVVGDGPLLPRLRRQHPQVHFTGMLPPAEVARYMASSDCFVFPSLTDTLGLVIMEALACGLPVAAFPVQGPRNLIQSGETGFLDHDLRRAALQALCLEKSACREQALRWSWQHCAHVFLEQIEPLHRQHDTLAVFGEHA
jgi:glycosyltransferase involved in cell wall biosynthesis